MRLGPYQRPGRQDVDDGTSCTSCGTISSFATPGCTTALRLPFFVPKVNETNANAACGGSCAPYSGVCLTTDRKRLFRKVKDKSSQFYDGFAHSDVRLAPEREIGSSQALFRVVSRLLYMAALNDNATEKELKRERENNATTLESSTPLNYGNVIQLQHVQSGKFLPRAQAGGARA
eukprot:g1496.t1